MSNSTLSVDRDRLARRYVKAVWNDGELSFVDEITADDVRCYGTSFGDLEGPDAVKEFVELCRLAYPGLVYHVDDIAVETDVVTVDWVATVGGTVKRRPARTVMRGATTLRVEGSEITETWDNFDPWLASLGRDDHAE